MANANDFFDPAIQQAQFVAKQVTSLSEESLIANGATKFAGWQISMDANAVLKSLERLVRTEALGKVFGDGAVFAQIPDVRTADISFYKLKDGSGVAIAKLDGGQDAMKTLLSKADMSDLDLMPKAPVKKQPKAEALQGKLSIGNGQELTVNIAQEQPAFKPGRHVSHREMGGAMQIPAHNPVAMKAFLAEAWSAPQQSIPMPDAQYLSTASLMAATSDAHPEDDAWPEGITAVNTITGEAIASPKSAMAQFDAALEGREGPVMERETLGDAFKKFRAGKDGATEVASTDVAIKPRAPGQ